MKYHIGTSGWSYKHWFNGIFYPRKLPKNKAFQYYQSVFNTVELNVTFYRLLTEGIFEDWYEKSTKDFIFSIKGSRYITTNKKLKDTEEALNNFFLRINHLKEKAGPILWQLPPSFKLNIDRLKKFIEILPDNHRHCFEFRNDSWFNDFVYELLRNNNMAIVIADSSRWPCAERVTADFIYLRLHGREELYESNYTKNALSKWAYKINDYKGINDAYIYFNNDYKGYAAKNAHEMKKLIK